MTERLRRRGPGATSARSRTRRRAARARSRALLDLPEPPTAIMTSTDTLAFGVLHAAYSLGRAVPDDLSVVGFDDILLASHTVPALTTLRMPTAAIVAEGVQLAIEYARDASAARPAGGQGDHAVADRPPVDGAARRRWTGLGGRPARPAAAASSRIARRRFITSLPPRPK